ncbi:cytochrome P450 4F12-like [Saccoglossus kowalevskii]|uniref:Cytochrome P450 4F12-like n=1 Tax=Saccoglossus kowalevskii TaxID=10224 RepID=A0ABM0MPW5_SACKO|nr:PREDICTED: cytochrome P450 4F12-like [Saccoglossus kowalevskii]
MFFEGILWRSVVGEVLVIVIVLKVTLTLVNLNKQRRYNERALSFFPGFKKHFLLGDLDKFRNDEASFQWTTNALKNVKYGFQLWAGPFIACLSCIHPDTIRPVLVSTEPKDEFTYGMVKPWLGDGLLLSKGNKWFRNRRLLTPGFHFDILRPYVGIFNDCTNTLIEKWSQRCHTGSLEMFEHISLLTLHSLIKCLFSQEIHCQVDGKRNSYVDSVKELALMVDSRIQNPLYYSNLIYHLTYSGYKWRKALNVVHTYSRNVIQQRKETIKLKREKTDCENRRYVDFLDILLAARDENGEGLTDREIRDEVDTFMFEGHDTTASGLSWCLYNLAKNPEHQKTCQQEIDALLEKKGEDKIEWNDLNHLNYVTMCIKESLRITPAVPFVGRKLSKSMTFPELNVTIPEGIWIGIGIMGLHENRFIWDNPEVYDPLRFTPENCQGRSPYAFLPFSAGPRNCIGQNFAMSEMKTVIALLLRKFEFVIDESVPARRRIALVMRSEGGLRLFVKPRHTSGHSS